MKTLLKSIIILGIFILSNAAYSQSPEGINYQATVRDVSGNLMTSQSVTVIFAIKQGSATGTITYQETHTLTTNAYGGFNTEIGSGTATTGTFSSINWGGNSYFLNVTVDGNDLGTTQLISVPYALYAKTSGSPASDDQDIDSVTLNGDTLTVYINNGASGNVSLATLTNFEKNGNDIRVKNGNYNSNFIIGSPQMSDNGNSSNDLRMFYDKSKGAFRAGRTTEKNWDTDSLGMYSFASGSNTKAKGFASTAMGIASEAIGNYSTSIGYQTIAIGDNSTALGRQTEATGDYSIATGYYSEAIGLSSTAMGDGTLASGDYSFATGESAEATGDVSIAMGQGTFASGDYSIAMGYENAATGYSSFAVGFRDTAFGNWSTAMGYQTRAIGAYSTAMGRSSIAIGTNSFAIGKQANATGFVSIAMGDNTDATGNRSTAFGASTNASGSFSTAMGSGTNAKGESSTSMGEFTIANGYASTVVGLYNQTLVTVQNTISSTTPLFVVGNGDLTTRSNAMAVLKNGNVDIAGRLKIGSSETIEDFGVGILAVNCHFVPKNNLFFNYSLGSSANKWQNVWAFNGTINTSDTTLKTNITPLNYGLAELMKIKTISYNWIGEETGKRKIGFNAQNLQSIIPEVVVDEEEVINEETGEVTVTKTEKLGVYYSDMIPVLTKSIQEQQVIIEAQKLTNEAQQQQLERLKKELELLKKMIQEKK